MAMTKPLAEKSSVGLRGACTSMFSRFILPGELWILSALDILARLGKMVASCNRRRPLYRGRFWV